MHLPRDHNWGIFRSSSWKWHKCLQNSRTSRGGPYTTRNHHGSLSSNHVTIRKLFIRSFGRPGKSYTAATFWIFQKKARSGAQNGRPGPPFGQNLQNGVFSGFFDSRVLITWKCPFFWYMGRGGVLHGLCPKNAKMCSEVDFSKSPKSALLARGPKPT